MTEQTPAPLGDDERAELARLRAAYAAAEKVPYDQAAEHVGAEVDQGPQADAGASLAQMGAERGDPLPHEAEMDRMMAEFRAMSERVAAMETQLGQARSDYAAATAALGPPPVAVYGKALHDKLTSLRAAHPDAPAGHFDAVIKAAAPLAEASQAVIDGKGHVSDLTDQLPGVIDAVDRFVSKTHRRRWGKPIDFSAIESDLEYAAEAADQISTRAS